MTLFLCFFLCVSFVAAEKCENINNTVLFYCENAPVTGTILDECTPGKEIGCQHYFLYQNDLWNKTVKPIIYKTGDHECQTTSDINFSRRCSKSNCEMNVNDAANYCFNSTVEIICDDKKKAIKLPENNTHLYCLLTLQSKNGMFSSIVSTSIIKKGNDQDCKYTRNTSNGVDLIERVEYHCSENNCEKKFDQSRIPSNCKARSFLCGGKKYLKSDGSPGYCIYYWRRDEMKRFKEEPNYPDAKEVNQRIDKNATCLAYDYEQAIFVCWQDLKNPKKCVNVTMDKKKEYCGDKIEENRKGRLLVTVGFSIFAFLFIISIVYGSICTFRKAGKAHSILLHEYQLEFGSNPMTTSGSKKQKKRKRKEVNGGGKGKKVKRDPPF